MYAIWQDAFWRLVPGTKRAKEAFVRLAGVVELLHPKSHRIMDGAPLFEKNYIWTVLCWSPNSPTNKDHLVPVWQVPCLYMLVLFRRKPLCTMNIHHIRCRQFPILTCFAFCSTRSRVLIFEFELTCRDWLTFFFDLLYRVNWTVKRFKNYWLDNWRTIHSKLKAFKV